VKVEEATDVSRAFILAEGASGAMRVVETWRHVPVLAVKPPIRG
jgi:hypothetical protein